MNYPDVITPEILAKMSHITTQEVQRDIDDTRREIEVEHTKAKAYQMLADSGTDAKMNSLRARAAQDGVNQRKEFIAFLVKLLEARGDQITLVL